MSIKFKKNWIKKTFEIIYKLLKIPKVKIQIFKFYIVYVLENETKVTL